MSRRGRRGDLWCIVALASMGCSTAPVTELVVLVRIDPAITGTVTNLVIDVHEPDTDLVTTEVDLADLEGSEATLGVRHRAGGLSPLVIEARGSVGGATVSDRAITSFVSGQRRLLVLVLHASCVGVPCTDAATTCGPAGACVSAVRLGESLPLFRGDGDLDAGVPRDAPFVPTDTGELGDPCLFGGNCFLSERCEDVASGGGHCVEDGPQADGDACSGDTSCQSGACTGSASTPRCADECSNNLSCGGGMVCVADARTGYDGVCVAASESPCIACDEGLSACVVMRSGAPMCTTGSLCVYGLRCNDGETCAALASSAGGQAACVLGGACTRDEMAVDQDGAERCSNTWACTQGGDDCPAEYPECLPGSLIGFTGSRAGDLGVCVRNL